MSKKLKSIEINCSRGIDNSVIHIQDIELYASKSIKDIKKASVWYKEKSKTGINFISNFKNFSHEMLDYTSYVFSCRE